MASAEAVHFLRQLLAEPGPYRRRWERFGTARPDTTVNFAAVAQVLALHLWDNGHRSDADTGIGRTAVRHRVERAFRVNQLSAETLQWFVDAFEFSPTDADRLVALRSGSTGVRVLRGDASVSLPAIRSHRTVSLREHHFIGRDGTPERHVTTQVIQATRDGLDEYNYMFDTECVTLDVVHGGTADGLIRQVGTGIWAARIALHRPLTIGETTSLEYVTTFSYATPPRPEFRRAAFTLVDAIDLRVQFHPSCLPTRVSYATWPALDAAPDSETTRTLEPDGSVHAFLTSVHNSIVGFTWTWPAG